MDLQHSHIGDARPTCSCHHQQPKILHSLLTPAATGRSCEPGNCHGTPSTDPSPNQHQYHLPAANNASIGVHQTLLKSHLQGKLQNYPLQMVPLVNGMTFAGLPSYPMQVMPMMTSRTIPSHASHHNHYSHNPNFIPQATMDNHPLCVEASAPISPSLPSSNRRYRQRSGSTSSCSSSSSSTSSVTSRMNYSHSISSMSDRQSPSPFSPATDLDSGYSSSTSSSPGASGDSDVYLARLSPNATRDTCTQFPNPPGNQKQSQNIEISSKLYHMLRGEPLPNIAERDCVPEKPLLNPSPERYVCKKRPHSEESSYVVSGVMEQDRPIDLTCKRPRIELTESLNMACEYKYSSPSRASFQTKQQINANSPALPPCSSSPRLESPKSTPSPHPQSRPQTPLNAGSMLKQLLSGTVLSKNNVFNKDDTVDEIEPDIQPFASSHTHVTIAKKNLFPVSARVSDWVVKVVKFATSLPEFSNLTHNDKVTLLLTSWARIMLVQMAETNFQFAVTPIVGDKGGEPNESAASLSPETPTMSSVETIQGFIKKCQSMGLDSREFSFIKSAALFNSGYSGVLDNMRYVEEVNSCLRQALQDHIQGSTPKGQLMRYSQVLMCLPTLFGINCKMVEKLFCKHITGNMDMQVLLKEMLQNI